MKDVQFGDLVGRMVISLIVVLAVMWVAYRIIKRRQGGAGVSGGFGGGRGAMRSSGRRSRPAGRSSTGLRGLGLPRRESGRGGRNANARRGIKVVGRVGLSRSSSVVAVQFAGKVFMLGTSEQSTPTVLAELELAAWEAATEVADELVPIANAKVAPRQSPVTSTAPRPNVLDTLRELTARRA